MFQDPKVIAENLSKELESCRQWLIDNKLSLHLGKTEAIIFGSKRKLSKIKSFEVKIGENIVMSIVKSLVSEPRMSGTCGGCGRRWVEPRLLPCLHTLCTPCLHHRKGTVTSTIKRHPQQNAIENASSSCCKGSETTIQSASSSATSLVSKTSTSVPAAASHCTTTTAAPSQLTKYTASSEGTNTNNSQQQINGLSSVVNSNQINNGCITSTTYPTPTHQQNSHSSCNGHECRSHLKEHPHSSHISVNNNNYKGATTAYSTNAGENGECSSSINNSLSSLSSTDASKEDYLKVTNKNGSSSKQVADLDTVIALLSSMSPGLSSSSTPQEPQPMVGHTSQGEDTTTHTTPDSTSSSRTRSTRSTDSLGDNTSGVCVVWCPECGYEAEVPPGGVECFPLNYMLQKQLVLQALNSDNTTIYCDLCHDDVRAEYRCDTCPVNLCRLCSHAHARQRRTAHHTVISMEEARNVGIREVAHTLVCATHGEGEVGWWCRDCNEPLCTACIATLHRGHNTSTVGQEAPHIRAQLIQLLDQATNRVGDLLSNVEELSLAASRVQQRSHSVSDQVNSFIDDYITALEEHRHTLLRQVRQTCERGQRGIVTESQRAGQTASWLRQGADLTHDLVHHAGDAETLALAPLIIYRLQALIGEQVQQCKRWERLKLLRGHRAGKIRGHRIQGVIADTFADCTTSKLKPLIDDGQVSVGSRSVALLVTRDPDGQPVTHGGEEVQAHLLNKDGTTIGSCSVRDREDGSYEVSFSPLTAGTAQLHVKLSGHPVQGSPLEIDVVMTHMNEESGKELELSGSVGRGHTGIYHCCTFCSTSGDKNATCACGATMPG
ncbi:unnamed protein product, partial [Meganyctiphanes norvegica]